MKTGIYCWRNTANGKVYVGSAAVSLAYRRRKHVEGLRADRHPNKYLQHAWDKHGESTFRFEILELCPPELCVEIEQYWIDFLDAADHRFGYNINPTAGNRRGAKNSPEHTVAIVAAVKGRKHTPEAKAAIGAAHKGKQISAAHRRALREKLSGRRLSDELRQKLSLAHTGQVRSDEYRANISEGQRRRWLTATGLKLLAAKALVSQGVGRREAARAVGTSTINLENFLSGRTFGWMSDHPPPN